MSEDGNMGSPYTHYQVLPDENRVAFGSGFALPLSLDISAITVLLHQQGEPEDTLHIGYRPGLEYVRECGPSPVIRDFNVTGRFETHVFETLPNTYRVEVYL